MVISASGWALDAGDALLPCRRAAFIFLLFPLIFFFQSFTLAALVSFCCAAALFKDVYN